jgi:hypothetical protein
MPDVTEIFHQRKVGIGKSRHRKPVSQRLTAAEVTPTARAMTARETPARTRRRRRAAGGGSRRRVRARWRASARSCIVTYTNTPGYRPLKLLLLGRPCTLNK